MVHHHTTSQGNMDIFCSFPHAHCVRGCVGNLNQTRAGVHSGEDHGTEGQERVKALQNNRELAWNLVLTEEPVLWRRYCTIHSVQMKEAVQSLNNLAVWEVRKVGQEGRNAYI